MAQHCVDCNKIVPNSEFVIRCLPCWKKWQNGGSGNAYPKVVATFVPAPLIEKPESSLDEKMAVFDKTQFIELEYKDGEYLDGYIPYPSKPLEVLGMSHYVTGWGNCVDHEREVVSSLGTKFTIQQAIDYIRPAFEAALARKLAKKQAATDNLAAKISEAKTTGKQVILRQWSEDCDGSTDECDNDSVVEYVNPNGTHSIVRSHCY